MALIPGIFRRDFEHRSYLVNHHPLVYGADVTLDVATRSPLVPAYRIPAGTVVVRQALSKTFIDAEDPCGDRCEPAVARSSQPVDAAWANTTITASLASTLGFAIQLDAAAVTTVAVVDQLNRHPLFAAHFVADDLGGLVRVRTREAGAHKTLYVESTLPAAFGPLGTFGRGLDADYRVTDAAVDLRDLDGNPLPALVSTVVVGHFDEPQLLHLTPEARAVFSRRGSLFRP
jgi:hypothetical protein